ncbi:MAG: NosD domain-containing protein [Phycisphaerales bacterium]
MSIAGLSLIQTLAPLVAPCLLTMQVQRGDKEFVTIDRVEQALPVVVVDRDDFEIAQSCTVRIAPGAIIPDLNDNGVIHIVSDDVIVVFEDGSVLQGRGGIDGWLSSGTGEGEGWDTFTGTAITVSGHEGVEIIGAKIRGYRNGIVATDATGLVVRDTQLIDMYRQRLTSTATREGSGDWLYPHNNDDNEWLTNYGAAIWAERCHGAHFEGVKVRRGQNGIILDNTNGASVLKNDCSFLSGWGLAMWRASQNEITQNRFDFCVRGHVEGVYNRGQDSAGILMFEECTNNTISLNSCTHGGDGIFGFGGNDAVNKAGDGPWGNANNYFGGNDLSFAPAHGLEMTFSEGNRVDSNLFEANAICGIWGGYSQGFNIILNRFVENGGMAYGQERGGINIEHGAGNIISANRFVNNKVGVRLWWDNDENLLAQPGVQHRYRGVAGNVIVNNRFHMSKNHPFADDLKLIGIQVQEFASDDATEVPRVGRNAYSRADNDWEIDAAAGIDISDEAGSQMKTDGPLHRARHMNSVNGLHPEPLERRSPPGREWIVCDQWGPWDFESPLLREHSRSGSRHIYEIYAPVGEDLGVHVEMLNPNVEVILDTPEDRQGSKPWLLTIVANPEVPIDQYEAIVRVGDDWSRPIAGRFISTTWNARCWSWENDPLVDLEAWRAEAEGVQVTGVDQLDLPFGYNGPSRVNHAMTVSDRDKFAIIAETEIKLPKGTWKLSTLSDDGIRVFVNGEMRFERWDIHGPTPDETIIEVTDNEPTRIKLEYFENDGYATLSVDLQPIN